MQPSIASSRRSLARATRRPRSRLIDIPFARVLVAVVLASGAFAQSPATRTDALCAEWNRTDSPGCAVAVIRDGAIVHAKGYGMADLEHGVPIVPRTAFYIGSTSKQFVTACVALLVEDGKLGLDDAVREHVPEFPEYPWPVTVRQLVHHTSGVRDYLTLWALSGRDYLDAMPADAVLEMICRQRELNFEPGTRFLYSNSCYFLLGVIVERVSGESLREFAERRIFGPLGMRDTRFHDRVEELIPNRAFSYAPRAGGGFDNLILRFALVGSGGVYSTVEDLAKWDANFYANVLGKGGEGFVRMMLTRGKLADGTELDYAMALRHGEHAGRNTVGHGGALAGYRAELLRFPEERLSVVVLGNVANLGAGALAERIADVWLGVDEGAVAGLDDVTEAEAKVAAADAGSGEDVDAAEFAGRYACAELGVDYELRAVEGALELRVGMQQPMTLAADGEDRWKVDGVTLRFARGEDGAVTGFRLDAGRVRNLLFVKTARVK